jgi:hypothetical protein
MVKWLEEITVTPTESDSFYHFYDNRVLPSHVDDALAKEEGMKPSPLWPSLPSLPSLCPLSMSRDIETRTETGKR